MSPEGSGQRIVVAIDGPAGSGKSSVAVRVADALGVPHVDTGAFYRAATLVAQRAGVRLDDGAAVAAAVARAHIDRVDGRTMVDGEDVEAEIRGPAVTADVSRVAAHPAVREVLLDCQRAGVARDGGVVDGRDAATKVVPDADVKVWLDARIEERARRRADQAGTPDAVAHHAVDLRRRDAADAEQMIRAPDAVVVDTTDLTIEEVVARIASIARTAAGVPQPGPRP